MDKNQKVVLGVVLLVVLAGIFVSFDGKYDKRGGKEDRIVNNNMNTENIEVVPIEHATMVLGWGDKIIYVDPVGGADAFKGKPDPDLILLTDIHSDHLDVKTLEAVAKDKTNIIAPNAVVGKLPSTIGGTLYVMKNGQKTTKSGFSIEAVPMYNLPQKADSYHAKGRGNGYVVEAFGKRVYISGDTSSTPEMRALKNIDIAFVCMNLPYTMDVASAAKGVLAFKPKTVYPYHYRGTDGLSDVNQFKSLVNKSDSNIDVILLNWYPN